MVTDCRSVGALAVPPRQTREKRCGAAQQWQIADALGQGDADAQDIRDPPVNAEFAFDIGLREAAHIAGQKEPQ